jgi:tight adherence protein B
MSFTMQQLWYVVGLLAALAGAFTLAEFWYAAALTATLVAVILLFMAIYEFFIVPARKRRKITKLLKEGEHLRRIQILKERSGDQWDWRVNVWKSVLGAKRFDKLQTLMLQADVLVNPGAFLNWVVLVSLAGLGGGIWFLDNLLVGLFIALGLGMLPFLYLKWKKAGKTAKFEKQMPDAMELLARSLRAGHTLPSAIELLGEEMGDPMGTEMRIAYEEQKYGLSVSDSLLHMLQRVESMDLKYFVSAVLIQQETGGNLAELMENIARVVRSRLNFKAKVRGLTAPARYSAGIMIATPVVVFFIMLTVAPWYERVLIDSSVGRMMLVSGIGLTLLGAYLMRRMIRSVEA